MPNIKLLPQQGLFYGAILSMLIAVALVGITFLVPTHIASEYIHPTPRGSKCRVRIYLPEEERDARWLSVRNY
jgi:hypothetical protein